MPKVATSVAAAAGSSELLGAMVDADLGFPTIEVAMKFKRRRSCDGTVIARFMARVVMQ